ncbi:stalk domain-containing protein [Pelotomaculum propionicicum]|uniref:stalk domain-containing protein n=1 Tax=Pelotomaculum propionicicum TaxID=258475 RepID=UPI003B764D42
MYKRRGLVALLVSFVMLTMIVINTGTAAALGSPSVKLPVSNLLPPTDIKIELPDPVLPVVSESISIKAIPLYRCWNGTVHWYTTNADERDSWLANGFSDEGITCYISPAPLPNTVPLYKCMLYNDMYYATSSAERDAVISKYGFSYIGIEGYAIPGSNTSYGDVNVNRWYHPESDHSDGWEWLSGEPFVSAADMDRHHFYQVDAANIPGYNYEGVVFRAWSSPKVLQKIKLTAPNGGEFLKAGDVQEIEWTSAVDGGEMNLYYAADGVAANGLIMIKEELPNNGSYDWTVPNKTSSNVVIQARWLYHDNETDAWAYANDTSDSRFSIAGSGILLPGIDPNLTILKVFPAAPTGLTVTPYLFTRLDLSWKDNSSNETGFTIERKSAGGVYAKIATVGANTTKYSDTSAQFGTAYYYRVKANGNFDSGYSNEAPGLLQKFAVMPDIDYNKLIPAAPTNLIAKTVPGDPKEVELSWQASTSDIDGYIIERKSGSEDWEMSSTVGADKTSLTESGLSTNQSYSYRVRAYNMFLNSKPSNEVVYTPKSSSGDSNTSPGGQVTLEFFIGQGAYNVNGVASAMDVSPIIKESRTLLPIRFVTEAIGANIQWFDTEKKVLINQGATTIELWIGKNQARINGQSVLIDPDNASVMPLIVNGRTMMPLRFIAENLGCEVEWVPEFSQIKIKYQGNKLDPQPEPPME